MTKQALSLDLAVDEHIRRVVVEEVSARMAAFEGRLVKLEASMTEISARLGTIASNIHMTQQIARDTERSIASLQGHMDAALEQLRRDIGQALIVGGKMAQSQA
jgi:hypothetical protein